MDKRLLSKKLTIPDVNRLVADYLAESSYHEALNAFAAEAAITNENVKEANLRFLLAKSLFCFKIERTSYLRYRNKIMKRLAYKYQYQRVFDGFSFYLEAVGIDEFKSVYLGTNLLVVVRSYSTIYVYTVYDMQLQHTATLQGEKIEMRENILHVINGNVWFYYSLPALDLVYQHPIERGPGVLRFLRTNGQDIFVNQCNGVTSDDVYFYKNLLISNSNTVFTIKQLLFSVTFDISHYFICSLVYKVVIHDASFLVVTDRGVFKGHFIYKDLDVICCYRLNVPLDDFLVFDYELELPVDGFKDCICASGMCAIVLQDDFHVFEISSGKVFNHVKIEDLQLAASDGKNFVVCGLSELYYYGRKRFRVYVKFGELRALACSADYVVMAHDGVVEVMKIN